MQGLDCAHTARDYVERKRVLHCAHPGCHV